MTMISKPMRRSPRTAAAIPLLYLIVTCMNAIPTANSFTTPLPIAKATTTTSARIPSFITTRQDFDDTNNRQATTSLNAVSGAATTTLSLIGGSTVALPSLKTVSLACLIPTLSGFYKSEYGVSYAYGTAMTATSILILKSLLTASTPLDSIATVHAAAVMFYGIRLNLFLAYREIFLPRFRHMRERIEDRAKSRGTRLSRTPFIVSCAALYAFLATPLLVTSKYCAEVSMKTCATAGDGGIVWNLIRGAVVATWGGFLLEAWGDLAKSIGKARQGEDALITGGIFRFFRHPNYTGEIIGWVSSCVAAFLSVAAANGVKSLAAWKAMAPSLIACVFGASGISFVLTTATAGLESRQSEKYGDTEEYKDWVKKSWVGFQMGKSTKKVEEEESSEEGDSPTESED